LMIYSIIRIIVALSETERIMREIDDIYLY
jgi:hypothetical protein